MIQSDERCIEDFSECDVGGVIAGQVAPQSPHPIRQDLIGPQFNAQVNEVGVRLSGLIGAHCSAEFLAPNDIGTFERHQRWREKIRAGQHVSDPSAGGTGVQEHSDDG
jgi:hypothetical protein